VFSVSPISVNRAERNLLILLDWNVCIIDEDLCRVIEPFLSPLIDDIGGRHKYEDFRIVALQPVLHHHHTGHEQRKASRSNVTSIKGHPRFICWEHGCRGREFSAYKNLRRHQREKSAQEIKPCCSQCGAEFSRPYTRDHHIRNQICTTKQEGPTSRNRRRRKTAPLATGISKARRRLQKYTAQSSDLPKALPVLRSAQAD
jgi:hypothetical protein